MPEAPARRSVASKMSAEYGSARVHAGQWQEAAESNRPPKASSSVVDYQHPYSLKASFLHLSQQRRCACTSQMAHAILIRFQAVKLLTRKTAVSRVTGHGSRVTGIAQVRNWVSHLILLPVSPVLFVVCRGQ